MRYPALLGLLVFSTVGCDKSRPVEAPARANATAVSAITPGGTITGTVREQIPVDPYVYVRLATASGERWAAVNQAPLTVGSSITVYNVLPMEQFASKTLNRTFERIYFGALEPARGLISGSPASVGGPNASAALPETPPAPDAKVGPIVRARSADARTISELWTQKSHLAGATVTIRGVVVKYNAGVMGKNWIHLQDGSGDAARGTHDVAVTTLDTAAVGDTVTITGTVRTNRDVGAGYTFAVIVEEAKVTAR
ncbi:nucleotide-binding protein [Gemmatimonas sp.]|uniref:nucleotide-binding protein n=1 Tax=Gemmatimonas sp. TaxID=1962908 RepID=UPI00398366AA